MKFNKFAWCSGLVLFTFASVLPLQAQQDTSPPVLAGFDFSPKQVDTSSGPATITVSAHLTDDLSGSLSYFQVAFLSPSGRVSQYFFLNMISGTALDGVYQGQLTLPAYSEFGTWTVFKLMGVQDKAGNQGVYYTDQLQALGFPTTLTNRNTYKAFVQPPINADGTSIFKANRGVIPVKFGLAQNDLVTCSLPEATISVTRTAGGTLGSVDEGIYLTQADIGSNFRIDSAACQYLYNLAASSLGVGTYRVNISINGIVVGNAVFALK